MATDNYQKVLDRVFLVSEKLIVLDGINDIFEHIIKTAIILTGADAATVRMFNVEKGILELVKGYSLSSSDISQPPIRIGEGIAGTAVLEGKPFSTPDVALEERTTNKETAMLKNIRAALCVPLKANSNAIGCITLFKKKTGVFTQHDQLLIGIIASQVADALEKTHLIKELQKQATYDQLTGVCNKSTLLGQLDAQLDLSLRHSQSMSLIFLDIDHFKVFNDTHGHLLGDKLLSDFAKILKKCCRRYDVLGRFGGEEFLIIASQTSKKDSFAFCNKLRDAVKKHKFIGSGKNRVQVTFSAGISSFPEDGSEALGLLKKADQAMYKSKISGRDMITMYEKNRVKKIPPAAANWMKINPEDRDYNVKNEGI